MKRQQNFIKPQDIVILLKIISLENKTWNQKPMAEALGMSQPEISESVARSKNTGLLKLSL